MFGITLGLLALVAVVAALLRAFTTRLVVLPHEAVLVYRDGRDLGRLAPGVHRLRGDLSVRRFELRERRVKVAGQEVLTRDRVPVKFTVLVRLRVVDALRARDAVADLDGHVHAEAQLALREGVQLFELAELLDGRAALSERLTHRLRERIAGTGLEILDAAVQDVIVGGELKRAFGEVAQARAEALAKLERARGETAALRKLANAARLFRDHEGLARLKTLEVAQRAAENANNTLFLGLEHPLDGRKA